MKQFWLNKNECTGCGACSNICPKKAISLCPDSCGFIYPMFESSCIDCGLCEKACKARLETAKEHFNNPVVYAAWSNDDEVRFNSTTGGAFSEIAKEILSEGGFVAGAQYRDDLLVEHTLIRDLDGLKRIRQSKYIQSEPGNIYRGIKDKLDEGLIVAYCGAPCQVSALYAFLGKDYDNLLTIDFICRGMNSPKAYLSWIKEIESQEKKKVSRVWFKYKKGGWKSSPRRTRLDFADGSYIVKEGTDNLFQHGYLTSNLYIRPSCGNCKYKGLPRQGDITLADFWDVDKVLDDDKGTSMVIVNSEKGNTIFDKVKNNMFCSKRALEEVYVGNVCFNDSVSIPDKAEEFLEALNTMKFSDALKKYTYVPLYKKVIKRIKRITKSLVNRINNQ